MAKLTHDRVQGGDLVVANRESTQLLQRVQTFQLTDHIVEQRQICELCEFVKPFNLLDVIE